MRLLLVFLIVTQFALAQETNVTDAKGLKQGLWRGFYEGSKRIRYEGSFKDGKEVGTFKFFADDKNSTLTAERVFSDLGKTAYTKIYENGFVSSEGKTVNKKKEGLWKYYHPKSTALALEEYYKDDKLDSIRKVYYLSGKTAEEANYKNGQKNGAYKKITEEGIVLEETIYVNDQYDGDAIFRESDGKLASKGKFVKGEKKGYWEFYKDGKLDKREKYPLTKKKVAKKVK
jgi:antitoxin component YwqK of YwqJK toxin-antitoxin module